MGGEEVVVAQFTVKWNQKKRVRVSESTSKKKEKELKMFLGYFVFFCFKM